MPAKTLYLLPDVKVAGANWLSLQDGGTAPAALATATGWTVGQTASGKFSRMAALVERATTTFTTTAQPSGAPDGALGDSYRTDLLKGIFKAGTWTIDSDLHTNFKYNQRGRVNVRVWRSPNADGSLPTEITTARLVGTITPAPGTSGAAGILGTSSVSWSAPAIKLLNQYMFIQIAWEITTAPTAFSGQDVLYRRSSVSKIVTTDFSVGGAYVGMIGV